METKAHIKKTTWQGEPAVEFAAGGYEALVLPGIGANVIKLTDTGRGLDILRSPDNIETFIARPQVYGIPLLFPPNRISDGIFKVGEKVYNYPINEPANNNHIHGFLRHARFELVKETISDDVVEIEMNFIADKNTDFFVNFPHEFEFRFVYNLSKQGLKQTIIIKNNSMTDMPMGLGFHTAFKIPFAAENPETGYFIRASVGKRWELNERILPTGILSDLSVEEQKFRKDGVHAVGHIISKGHFTVEPIEYKGKPFYGALIEDRSAGLTLVYEVGQEYRHWMIWNDTGDKGFICPEPQTWAVNAPNINLPDDQTGFRLLKPGEVFTEFSRIYVERM